MTSGMMIGATVRHAGSTWELTRSWPNGDHDIFEARRPDRPEVIAGTWSPERGHRVVVAHADRRLPRLADLGTGTLISHRLGKRAVVRAADGSSYTKVVRPGRSTAILAGINRFAPLADVLRIPRVLAAFDDAVIFAALPGRTLHAMAADPEVSAHEWSRMWQAWSTQWADATLPSRRTSGIPPSRRAGGIPPAPSAHAAVHTGTDEARIVTEWIDRAARFLPAGTPSELRRIGVTIAEDLADPGGAVTYRIGHRDLHDKQILIDDANRIGVLDVDTAALIEPELDPANLAAHAELRRRQGHYSGPQATAARAAIERYADSVGCNPQRLRLYERAALLRLGCLYLFRPRWHTTARVLLDDLMHTPGRPSGPPTVGAG